LPAIAIKKLKDFLLSPIFLVKFTLFFIGACRQYLSQDKKLAMGVAAKG
jgi:hypothetical protein